MHVIFSLIGILAGLVVLAQMVVAKQRDGWNVVFLVATILTSVTGFLFHSPFGMAHVIGIIWLVVWLSRRLLFFGLRLAGAWRAVHVVTAPPALYFNVFVCVIEVLEKASFLQALAPTQSEPPLLVVKGVIVLVFLIFGSWGLGRFPCLSGALT